MKYLKLPQYIIVVIKFAHIVEYQYQNVILSYIKFGIGRTTSDASHEIRDGKITREEGVALVNKYDGEFPEKHYQEFLDYTNTTDEEFHQIIDSWRSDHLWEKTSNGWVLKKIIS